MLFKFASLKDLVDYSAPPLWGIENKASLCTQFNARNVHSGFQSFMLAVTSDDKLCSALENLNGDMTALWICAMRILFLARRFPKTNIHF